LHNPKAKDSESTISIYNLIQSKFNLQSEIEFYASNTDPPIKYTKNKMVVHGSLSRAGKVKRQTPKVPKHPKTKSKTGRAKKRMLYGQRNSIPKGMKINSQRFQELKRQRQEALKSTL
jgi:small subunit ribosomal protein S30e